MSTIKITSKFHHNRRDTIKSVLDIPRGSAESKAALSIKTAIDGSLQRIRNRRKKKGHKNGDIDSQQKSDSKVQLNFNSKHERPFIHNNQNQSSRQEIKRPEEVYTKAKCIFHNRDVYYEQDVLKPSFDHIDKYHPAQMNPWSNNNMLTRINYLIDDEILYVLVILTFVVIVTVAVFLIGAPLITTKPNIVFNSFILTIISLIYFFISSNVKRVFRGFY